MCQSTGVTWRGETSQKSVCMAPCLKDEWLEMRTGNEQKKIIFFWANKRDVLTLSSRQSGKHHTCPSVFHIYKYMFIVFRVSCLCSQFQAVLQHRLKPALYATGALSAIKQVAVGGSGDENSFWNFVKNHLTKHEVERYCFWRYCSVMLTRA